MKHGYDKATKCLFSWDRDFRYEGKIDNAPSDAFVVTEEHRSWFQLAGCHFLSGHRRNCVFYLENGNDSVSTYGNVIHADCKWLNCYSWEKVTTHVHPTAPICVCGPVAKDSAEIAKLCHKYPSHAIYVCPVVDELAAFGVLVTNILDKEKPRRTSLCVPLMHELHGEHIDFDPKLEGDGYGRMADLVRHGLPVLNDMMSFVGISPFYGKVLSKKADNHHTYLIRSHAVDRFFPQEPLSIKLYAATSVPVQVTNTKSFQDASGCKADKVNIVVSSDHIPGFPVFMNFYKIMSGDDFVGTVDLKHMNVHKKLPVFRYNRGYKMNLKDYERFGHAQ